MRPTHNELSDALHLVASQFKRAYIVLDALDECAINNRYRGGILNQIIDIQAKANVNLLATSRFDEQIASLFQGSPDPDPSSR